MGKTQNEWWLTQPTIKVDLGDGSLTLGFWNEVDKVQIKNRFLKCVSIPAEVLILNKDEIIRFIEEIEEKRQ